MADRTSIEWTDATWNPVTGCTKISRGCDNCYAERFAERFRGVAGHAFENGFDIVLRPQRLEQPIHWKKRRRIFVNSMSDLFHKKVPVEYVDRVFEAMEKADHHIYQVLTKRSSLMRSYVNRRYQSSHVPAHIWLGVSIENQKTLVRLKHLKEARVGVRFVSFEPLLESIGTVDLRGIGWVIAGGESGPRARPIQREWICDLRDQCLEQEVAFFFKQWGGKTPKARGNAIDGKTWLQFPKAHLAATSMAS